MTSTDGKVEALENLSNSLGALSGGLDNTIDKLGELSIEAKDVPKEPFHGAMQDASSAMSEARGLIHDAKRDCSGLKHASGEQLDSKLENIGHDLNQTNDALNDATDSFNSAKDNALDAADSLKHRANHKLNSAMNAPDSLKNAAGSNLHPAMGAPDSIKGAAGSKFNSAMGAADPLKQVAVADNLNSAMGAADNTINSINPVFDGATGAYEALKSLPPDAKNITGNLGQHSPDDLLKGSNLSQDLIDKEVGKIYKELGSTNPEDADKIAALVNDQLKAGKAKSVISDSSKKFFS